MSRLDELRSAYEDAKAQQAEISANPEGATAKKTARGAGAAMFVIGLIGAGIAYYLYAYQGIISGLVSAATLTFLGLGLYAMVTGKMPKKR
ncbi:MAG: hypothetical protein AAF500_05240 [Myxococcota bacterium]